MSKKILIVDDEKKIVSVVRGYLEQAGFGVVTASNGKQALIVFRHEKPDLVLLDLNMPEMDGLDVTRTLRKESAVPIIMLTARRRNGSSHRTRTRRGRLYSQAV